MADLLVHGANELVVGPEDGPGTGDSRDGTLETYEDGAVAIGNGEVLAVGPTEAVRREYPAENATRVIDATGRTVLPGLVDPHTHALFAGDRTDEFVARTEGKRYTEIMAEGGGIVASVEAVRAASDDRLRANLEAQLDVMLAHGTTTVEVKSGYGLDTETELRMLEAIRAVDESHPVDLVATFMGAHAVPDGHGTEEYVEQVIDEQIPAVAEQGIAVFCDVFCEEGVFSVDQSRRILEAGKAHGLAPKLHAEEFERIGGAGLAADLHAASADHLLAATAEDAERLREAGVVPTFLPATALSLGEPYADPSPFLDGPVTLATDLNPGCFVHSMATVTSLACMGMGLHPSRAIRAATHDAALAVSTGSTGDDPLPAGTGTLAEGTAADLAAMSERRVDRLLNPNVQEPHLPPFLADRSGLESGLMIPQYTAAALVNESHAIGSAATDTISVSGNQEDHVSMSASAAFALGDQLERTRGVLAVELLCGAEAAEYVDGEIDHGRGTGAVYGTVRESVAPLDGDRPLSGDIDVITGIIESGQLHERVAESLDDGFADVDRDRARP